MAGRQLQAYATHATLGYSCGTDTTSGTVAAIQQPVKHISASRSMLPKYY